MNKAQPWNINGVGFDARDAAREAARRQGKSLGEWLHGVIADHAEDHGLAPRAIGGQERIHAVTARLEQMGARPGAADHARRGARIRPDPRARSHRALDERDPEDFDQEDGPAPRAADRRTPHGAPDRDDGDDLLENAIAAMERPQRPQRAAHRSGPRFDGQAARGHAGPARAGVWRCRGADAQARRAGKQPDAALRRRGRPTP